MRSKHSKIILVDDNVVNLMIGKNVLKEYHEVYTVSSAEKLFKFLERFIPDVILLDIEMPVMNGFEAMRKLKSDERFVDIPVILITATDDVYSRKKSFELGAADYVTKPFAPPLLLECIASQLAI